MDKEDMRYRWILFSHEKQGNPATDDNMDGPSGYSANEESQAQKDK